MRNFTLTVLGMATMATSLSAQVPPPPSMAPVPTLAAPLPGRDAAMYQQYGHRGPEIPNMAEQQGLLPMPAHVGEYGYSNEAYAPIPFDESSKMSPCPSGVACPEAAPIGPYLGMQQVPQVAMSPMVPMAAGYPFYRIPVPASSMAMHSAAHSLRKRALFHGSPGNMIPTRPIYPVAGGSYYFRPYNYGDVYAHQVQASLWKMHPGFPYAEVAAAATYPDSSACLTGPGNQGNDPSSQSLPSRAFQRYNANVGR